MSSLPRVRGAAVAASLLMLALAGCAAAGTVPTPPPGVPTPTPTIEPVIGASALPLGCAELLSLDDLKGFVPTVGTIVDERHLIQRIDAVQAAQRGDLRCGWAEDEFDGTGWTNQVDLRIAPSTDVDLPQTDESGSKLTPVPAAHPTARYGLDGSCAVGDDSGAAFCRVVQLRGGYRLELDVAARVGAEPSLEPGTLALLEKIGSAIDGAGPMRVVSQPSGTTDPAALCAEPSLRSVVDARGASGEPVLETWPQSGGIASMTRCEWNVTDEWGFPNSASIQVLPGGAWAFESLSNGIGSYPFWFTTADGGAYLVGSGDGVAALRVVGEDLIEITAAHGSADPAAWEQLLDATW